MTEKILQNKAIVVSTTPEILVVPMLGDVCISCERTGCAKHGTPFKVSNTKMLNIKKGDIVHIHAKAAAKTFQGLFALFFPLASAVAAYFVLARNDATEGAKAGAVLAALAAASAIVIIASSITKKIKKAEIVAIDYA